MDPSGDTAFILLNIGDIVTVTEDVPADWSLDDIVCEEPSGVIIGIVENGRSFECIATSGGSANCTFFNSMEEPPPAQVPTLSEWGLVAMATILGVVGYMVIRRRKVTA